MSTVPYLALKAAGSARARRAEATRAMLSPSSFQPAMWPPRSMRSKSYICSILSFRAERGSITVFSGSSARSMMWGSSRGAFLRTATRGGMRDMTVPSVARTREAAPGS